MREIIVNANDAGQRLDKFLSKTLKELPKSLMCKYIRKKCIKVNGKRCEVSTRLAEGDVLTFFIKDEFFESKYDEYDFLKAPVKLDIVYEDENIMLLNKKPGLLVHPDETYHFDSLIARVQHYLYDKGEYDPADQNSFAPALVNRIDRNTCGIVIAVKNSESLRIMNQKMKDRELEKFYICEVVGRFKDKSGLLEDFLTKDEKKKKVFVSKKRTPDSKTIRTQYKVLSEDKNMSVLEVKLLTGRTHQIRAHMAFIGHPIVGDGKYGENKVNRSLGFKYQALCSYKLKFNFKSDAGILQYLNGKCFEVKDIWFLKDKIEKLQKRV